MEQLPLYIEITFILSTVFVIAMLLKVTRFSIPVIAGIMLWLAFQAALSLHDFYLITKVLPPRLILAILPPLLLISFLFILKKGNQFLDSIDTGTLTLLHIVRIPVELTLYWLFIHKAAPKLMTFEGGNLDILSGLSAPLIFYFGYIKKRLNKKILITWNLLCLLLLANIVARAILSAPFPFQQFGQEQPDIAILYFPYIWLPCFIVPVVLFSHLTTLKRLFTKPVSELNK